MGHIIGFSGRLGSGKTELAKICEKYNYKRIYFAMPLKQLCADLLDISLDSLNQLKRNNVDISFRINEDMCRIISEETGIDIETTKKHLLNVEIKTVRDMLQIVGTNFIRRVNKDWHVNRVIATIDKNESYVIDDVRFPNEKEAIEKANGDTWFVVRPDMLNVSNHESETSLKWFEFGNKIIINDDTLEYFTSRWDLFMNDYDQNVEFRDKIMAKIRLTGKRDYACKMLMIPSDLYTYFPIILSKMNENDVKVENNKVYYKNEKINNSLEIEDLKICIS